MAVEWIVPPDQNTQGCEEQLAVEDFAPTIYRRYLIIGLSLLAEIMLAGAILWVLDFAGLTTSRP